MSIRVPSSRGPKEESHLNDTDICLENNHSHRLSLSNETSADKTQTGNAAISDTKSFSASPVNSRQSMEMAVSNLAKAQQAEIQRLMQQQEKERMAMKTLFEQQQKRLIQVSELKNQQLDI